MACSIQTVLLCFVPRSQIIMVTAGSQLLINVQVVGDIDRLVEQTQEKQRATLEVAPDTVRLLSLQQVSFAGGERRHLPLETTPISPRGVLTWLWPFRRWKSVFEHIPLGLNLPDIVGRVVVHERKTPLVAANAYFMLVEPHPEILSTADKENLRKQVSDEKLYAALERVSLDEFACSLKQGLSSRQSHDEERVSSRQCQPLGTARTLICLIRMSYLDETTSAPDLEEDVEVVGKLRARMRDQIIIFIAHDEELSALADRVLHIQNGNA